ncbi:hypothetical protein HNV11_06485 [Spirosoma taeanense]|uniref:Uncharacterized protein n=1 Tax=Spirosoma taeanense TaxID=2735870 RepID=A0A6M5Y6U5_9BACT|nr:hypothetical protein [Spirosoma taeanense]QJW89060.1 hypothetical protein HNV11_06485 [Spirosoma taeanense]
MNLRLSAITLALALLVGACKIVQPIFDRFGSPATATITKEGLLTCFAPETSLNGQPVWCEASAVLFDGKRILVANDKDMPASLSPVFINTIDALTDSLQKPTYFMQPTFAAARKYEDFAQTPNGKFVFLTTAFDRIKPNSHDWDGYNTVLYWRKGDEQHPRVLAVTDTSRTSISYRQRIATVLANAQFPGAMPYFKIEGLAATDRQLLFGIREEGKAFDKFDYRTKIIGVSYRIESEPDGERIRLADDWKLIADFNPAKAEPALPQPLGLSSLEYDPYRKRFWMLTSQEVEGKLDAYLWTATPAELYANKPFKLIRDVKGQPLHLNHKAEDLTPLDRNRLLLIHDDDRVRTRVGSRVRQPNQAAYTIVTIN